MKKFFLVLGYPFIKAWKFINSDKADKIAKYLQDLMLQALPIVKLVASLTPTRIDDELIALFERFALPGVEEFLKLPIDQRGKALFEVAVKEMQKKYPNLPLTVIHKAVQDAVLYYKFESGQFQTIAGA